MRTKDVFCANCQQVTVHTAQVDLNGEFLFTCTTHGCDRFVKFPADVTVEQLQAGIVTHEEANQGQVSVEASEATLNAVLDQIAPETTPNDSTEEEAPAEPVDEVAPADNTPAEAPETQPAPTDAPQDATVEPITDASTPETGP